MHDVEPIQCLTSGLHDTLDNEIHVKLTHAATQKRVKTRLTDDLSSSFVDGTVAATFTTAGLELLNQWYNVNNDFSFDPEHGYHLAYIRSSKSINWSGWAQNMLKHLIAAVIDSYRVIGPIVFFLVTLALFCMVFLAICKIDSAAALTKRIGRKTSRTKDFRRKFPS